MGETWGKPNPSDPILSRNNLHVFFVKGLNGTSAASAAASVAAPAPFVEH